ncbi:hypothetical protein [Stackebrandtia nassauensis]|uniref:Lipoprotein n=1 Tax=Stackebrandtia nassauensis (strain DSM 44728 / CIP 108903 / NRRL B-16338 / NBRC 102104 / LLR-40K-21) TaxID=446470 RepID=D3Q3N9_STANL|nr:hypothetical protein [Stackebrandtia nassauensis]ADD43956.1 hypothetical protein Snas_4309 [Stackebrandtia nassauensis DSM 44728]
MKRSLPALAIASALLLTACGQRGGVDDGEGGAAMDGAEFSSSIDVDGDDVTVEFTLNNTGSGALLAYDRGWVTDPKSPTDEELEPTEDDVQIIVDGDSVEFGLRIIHACHGNPQGEMPPEEVPECETDTATGGRYAATIVEPDRALSREYQFDAASVWPDYPTKLAGTTIDLKGKDVRFCLGVDRPENPADEELYPPEAAETVLCGEAVTVD